LSDECFAGWHVSIVLDPGATDGLEQSVLDLGFDAVEERWVKLME
jgi:hypothetical protein